MVAGWLVAVLLATAAAAASAAPASSQPPGATASAGSGAACAVPSAPPVPDPTAPMVMPEDYRLKLLDSVWQQLADGYVDPGMNGLDWQAVHTDYAQRILIAENAYEDYAILEEMVGLLKDPDTAFISAQTLESVPAPDPSYGGIGILVDAASTATPDKGLRVLYVFPGGPAEAAGIAPRDVILAVGDDPCPRPDLVRGPVGSDVTLLVRSPGQDPRTIEVGRQRIAPAYTPIDVRIPEAPGIGYLRLLSLSGGDVPAAASTALTELLDAGPLDGLVIDLRHTTQGAPGVTTSILGQFVGGAVGTVVAHGGDTPFLVQAGDLHDRLKRTPLAVLVDAQTDGEAERLAAILQSQGRAVVVGQRTPGHTQLIQQVPLPDGSVLQMVVGGLMTSDGTRIEGHGVIPDIVMTDDWLDQAADADTWVHAAVQALADPSSAGSSPR